MISNVTLSVIKISASGGSLRKMERVALVPFVKTVNHVNTRGQRLPGISTQGQSRTFKFEWVLFV